MTEFDLLQQFRAGSQDAFAQLVRTHSGWIHAAALRRTRDPHLADDVTQATFIVLARDAAKFRYGASVGPWLFRVMSYSASMALRADMRRRRHERIAASMRETSAPQDSAEWKLLSGEIDEYVMRLKQSDREAIVLRFYEGKTLAEMARGLGIGEDAARKRVDRAIGRLRQRFQTRGVTLSAGAVATALAMHASPAPTAAALAAGSAAISGGNSAATVLAAQATRSLIAAKLKLAAVAILVLLFAVTAPMLFRLPAHRPVIKVGWMVSSWTATEHPYNPRAFDCVTAIRPRFLDPQIELYAIIEPGTENVGGMPVMLKTYFQPGRVIDGTDAAALSKLDVIVCSRDWNMRADVMNAILKAVNNGTGLLRHLGTGVFEYEGDYQARAQINCIDDIVQTYTAERTNCVVVSDHPLLAGIRKSLPDGRLDIANLNGCIGIVHGTPLIVADAIADGLPTTAPTATTAPTDRRLFCPMFISQIGKGRVVACQWDSIPKPLVDATNGRFYIHCVQWLANRPLE